MRTWLRLTFTWISIFTECHLCQKPGHFVAQCPILPVIAEALGKAAPEAQSHATYVKQMEEALIAKCDSRYDSDVHVF